MTELFDILEAVRPYVFGLLAVIAGVQWLRHRSAPAAWAALTFLLLESIIVVSELLPEVADTPTLRFTQKCIVAVFALFPYFLLRFMASFKRPPRGVMILANLLTAATMAGPFLFDRLPETGEPSTAAYSVYIGLFLTQFVFLSLVVAASLWRAGKGLPAVARNRMRTLSLGSLALALALVASVAAPQEETADGIQVAIQVFALGSALLFLVGFAPPASLRSRWRRSEGVRLGEAEAGLMEAQTAEEIAAVILPRVALLAGGREALLVGEGGRVIGHYSSGEKSERILTQGTPGSETVVKVPVGDGHLLVEASEFAPLFGTDEVRMVKRVGFLADLAAQRALLAERQSKLQQQLVEAQEVAGVGSWEWDLETTETVWSDQMFSLLGVDPATTKASSELYTSHIHPEDRPPADQPLSEIATPEYENEHRLIRSDGTVINVKTRAKTIFDDDGRPLRMIGTSQDVTVEKKLEVFRTQFIANAAHELRTPLTSLLGFIEIVTGRRDKMTAEQLDEAFEVMGRSGTRLSILVQNMLDLAKLQQGNPDVVLVPTDLKAAVERSLELSPPPSDVRLTSEVENVFALADPNRLEQIVTNLLTNAYKYGGKHVTVTAEQHNGRATLTIADDGEGVDPDLAPFLFDPFTRGSESHHIRGSGLGLSIVHMLIEASGGEIRYEPVDPHGARFCIELEGAPNGDHHPDA